MKARRPLLPSMLVLALLTLAGCGESTPEVSEIVTTTTATTTTAADQPSAITSEPATGSEEPAADLGPLFDRLVFRGKEYDATYAGDIFPAGPEAAGVRYADVYFPFVEPRSETPWKTGGIVRLWGGGTPRVVVVGSSHALMYAGIIDDICKEAGISVAFLTAGGKSVFSDAYGDDDANADEESDSSFYDTRTAWIREWKPAAVIAVDRWDSYSKDPTELTRRFDRLLAELEPYAQRIIVLNQIPALSLGQDTNLREYVAGYRNSEASLPVIPPDKYEAWRQTANEVLEAAAIGHPKLELIRADSYFLNADGSIRYAEGRAFYYADDDHLTDAGAAVLREPLTRAITSACEAPMTAMMMLGSDES